VAPAGPSGSDRRTGRARGGRPAPLRSTRWRRGDVARRPIRRQEEPVNRMRRRRGCHVAAGRGPPRKPHEPELLGHDKPRDPQGHSRDGRRHHAVHGGNASGAARRYGERLTRKKRPPGRRKAPDGAKKKPEAEHRTTTRLREHYVAMRNFRVASREETRAFLGGSLLISTPFSLRSSSSATSTESTPPSQPAASTPSAGPSDLKPPPAP